MQTVLRSVRLPRPSSWLTLVAVVTPLLLGGCESVLSSQQEGAATGQAASEASGAGAGRKSLSELVHRYVLASPLLDECIEEWGGSNKHGVEIDFRAMPSGELALVSVNGEREGMHACVGNALAQIRLPAGSVSEAKIVTVSIR